jgi:hypothetical protein
MTNAFDTSGPSQIIAANRSMTARMTTLNRRTTTGTISGLNRTNDERIAARAAILLDNTASPFCTAIAPPFSAGDKTRRILGRSNTARSE